MYDDEIAGDRAWFRFTLMWTDASTGEARTRAGMQLYRIDLRKLAKTWLTLLEVGSAWPGTVRPGYRTSKRALRAFVGRPLPECLADCFRRSPAGASAARYGTIFRDRRLFLSVCLAQKTKEVDSLESTSDASNGFDPGVMTSWSPSNRG